MDLPVELLHQIVVDLDAISYHSIILASRELRAILHGTFSTAFILSKAEYVLFNKMYEEHAGRKPRRLLCAMCTNLLTDAKFADRQAGQFCQTVRTCVSCGINNGKYNRATFIYKGNTRFGCAGCKLPCKMENEEQGIGEFTFTEHFPFRDPGYGRAVEISLDARGKRWCKTCWRGAMGFMESIGMKNHTQLKVKQVWL